MGLKIYFCGSIHGGRDDAGLYAEIIEQLKSHGTVLTEHVGDPNVIEKEKPDDNAKQIHDKDVAWLTESDVIIAEVTQPSLGVGYEIGRAVEMKKPILCLFRPSSGRNLSCMIQGRHDGDDFVVVHYEKQDYKKIVDEYLVKLKKKQDVQETE